MRNIFKEFEEIFKKRDYKLTKKRYEILLTLLENSHCHLSTEEIHEILKGKESGIGIATVYRTLQILEEINLVQRSCFDDGCVRYQYADSEEKHEHHHLVCEDCGNVVDIHEDFLELLEEQVLKSYGFEVTNHKLMLFGKCKICAQHSKAMNNMSRLCNRQLLIG